MNIFRGDACQTLEFSVRVHICCARYSDVVTLRCVSWSQAPSRNTRIAGNTCKHAAVYMPCDCTRSAELAGRST